MKSAFEKKKIKSIKDSDQHIRADKKQDSLPNSLVMRIMEDSQAEKEANQLSKGVVSNTPDGIMREMGNRLGADFSNVQFHSDSLSANRGNAMGARAWAQGRDVYFGQGGFDPKVAAHELVHTVQQGAVRGDTAQRAPTGAVQLFRREDENAIHRRIAPANASNLELMTDQKNSSEFGPRVFNDLVKPVKNLALKSGSRIRAVNGDSGLAFLANLGERDYSGKEILRDIATRTVINKDEMYDRTDEYESFIDFMKQRTNKVGLEAASMQAGILNGQPRYNHDNDQNINKRAYEMSAQELANDTINPTHDAEIAEALRKIDNAHDEKEAYHAFLEYTNNKEYTQQEYNNSRMVVNFARQPIPIIKNDQGVPTEVDPTVAAKQQRINDDIETRITDAKSKMRVAKEKGRISAKGDPAWEAAKKDYETAKAELKKVESEKQQKTKEIQYRYKNGATVNVPLLKAKLKNMVRQVRDYPELKHKIGGLNIKWNQKLGAYRDDTSREVMAATISQGASEPAMITYDAFVDRDSPEAEQERIDVNNTLANSIGNLNKVGNHELGHVLESTLNIGGEDFVKRKTSNDILQSVLPKVMSQDEQNQVNYNQQDGLNAYGKRVYQGQIDTNSPIFGTKEMSSEYGQSMPTEWFAEAFHDVYTKGADAKPTSIEIVKEYERRSTEQQKSVFQKKERSWYTRFGRWISKKFGFGRRHDAPQVNPMNAMQVPAQPIVPPAGAGQPQQIAAADPEPGKMENYEEKMAQGQDANPPIEKENELDKSMIVEMPKRRKNKKKKKKK